MTEDRIVRCRYLRRNTEFCTGEAIDPEGDILICQKHAARVMALIGDQMERAGLTLGLKASA